MWSVTLVFAVHLVAHSFARNCPSDRTYSLANWEHSLQDQIKFCSNDRPVAIIGNKTTLLNVKVHFFLKYFKFDDLEEVFIIKSWMLLKWRDPAVYWDKNDYGGLDEVVVPSENLFWSPVLTNLDATDDHQQLLYFTQCTVNNTGYIICLPRMEHTVLCSSKLMNWPYDTQECTLKFGEIKHEKYINFSFVSNDRGVSFDGVTESAGWFIKESKSGKLKDSAIYIKFTVKRISDNLEVIVLSPVFVTMIVTLVTLFFHPRNKVRFTLLVFNVMTCYETMMYLSYYLPKHGVDTPTVLLLVRSSMILTVFVLLSTMFVSSLYAKVSPVYLWINLLNDKLLNSHGKYLVMKFDAIGDSNEVKSKCRRDWADFANIVNSILAITVITVYLYCVISYLPTKSDD